LEKTEITGTFLSVFVMKKTNADGMEDAGGSIVRGRAALGWKLDTERID